MFKRISVRPRLWHHSRRAQHPRFASSIATPASALSKLRLPLYGSLVAVAGLTLVSSSNTTASVEAAKLSQTIPARSGDPLTKLDATSLASSVSHLDKLSISQLIRPYLVFLSCSSPLLIRIAPATIEALENVRDNVPILGQLLWQPFIFVMRHTFFAQFVAGETAAEADPLLHELRERSCGAMLNWSAEAIHSNDTHGTSGVLPEAVQELTHALEAISRFQPASEPISTILAVKSETHAQFPDIRS